MRKCRRQSVHAQQVLSGAFSGGVPNAQALPVHASLCCSVLVDENPEEGVLALDRQAQNSDAVLGAANTAVREGSMCTAEKHGDVFAEGSEEEVL